MSANGLFTIINLFHLAYLGQIFDTHESESVSAVHLKIQVAKQQTVSWI